MSTALPSTVFPKAFFVTFGLAAPITTHIETRKIAAATRTISENMTFGFISLDLLSRKKEGVANATPNDKNKLVTPSEYTIAHSRRKFKVLFNRLTGLACSLSLR